MTIRDELQRLFDAYVAAYRAGDATGCAALFTADAEMHSPFGPACRGRKEIEDTHREWLREVSETKRIRVVAAESSGNLAWGLAEFSEGTETGEGVSLNVFERQPEGGWLIRMCSLNET